MAARADDAPYARLNQAKQHWDMIDRYCVKCHNVEDWAGKIAFDSMLADDVPKDAETWERAVRRLRGGLMPPPGEPRPDNARVANFVDWLEGYLDHSASKHVAPGRVALHRLNRREYANAVKYLLDLDIDAAALLPQDDVSDGFDNIANVLQVSPSFLDSFLAAARTVAVQAVGNPNARPVGAPYVNTQGGKQHFHVHGLPLGTRGGMAVDHLFPADGEYELNISDIARALWVEGMEFDNTLIATLDGVKFFSFKIGGDEQQKSIDQNGDPAVDAINKHLKKIRFQAKAGRHQVAVTFIARSFAESDARLQPLLPGGGEERVPKVNSIEILGPLNVTGMSSTASRERIFTCYPKTAAEESPCARQIIRTIAYRAYRGSLTDAELANLMQTYRATREERKQSFDEGVRAALTRILASPNFLYRTEPAPADAAPGATYRLTDLQLASRLAFFLWSNLPDDELLDVAAQGKLRDAAVLKRQVRRMLADPKAQTLANDFAFQWLGLAKLADIEPDPNVFPYASDQRDVAGDLRDDFRRELALFIDSVFRENRSVAEMLTGKHTFVNERLALHYDIRNVKGDAFRRVELADSTRWGLLGKAGLLMATSYPNRTAPVLRGAWILENIMGTPPAAPPPVAALKENVVGQKPRTMREMLAAHSTNKTCYSCHAVMDPLGFALENFDAVGKWRLKDRTTEIPVDTHGELPDGTPVNGPNGLRQALMSRPEQFIRTLTQKLMTYGVGRSMEMHDMPTVRAIVKQAARDNYTFESLALGIVQSPQFQMQQAPSSQLSAQETAPNDATLASQRQP